MGKKATNLEVQERVNCIYQLLIKSWSRFDILQYAATEWDLSSRQTDEYIHRARKLIEEDSAIERPQWLAAACLLYTSPSPRDYAASRMPSSA